MLNIEKVLEFDKIKEMLGDFALTESAKGVIKDLKPYLFEMDVRKQLKDTTEAKIMLENCGNPPITALENMSEYMQIAESGGCLTPEQLDYVAVTLTAVRRLKDYLMKCKAYELSLAYYDENLDPMEEVYHELSQKIRNGDVDDYATKNLRSVREEIAKTELKMRDKAEMILKTYKEWMSDSFSTVRNGHICVPVKKEYKNKIDGSVIDKSSTGSTLFIEPEQVARLYGELEERKLDEENEVMQILYKLTALLSDKAQAFRSNHQTIERLDFIFAKAKLSMVYHGVEPAINTQRYMHLKKGRHPLMDPKTNVPLDFSIGEGINGIIITGPNTGGKTVAIKTVALACLLAQCGLHVPCEQADVCINDIILCDIGDGQKISENLSTFSAHIVNILDILRKADKDSLVVIDELGSGTDPTEGMGIAIAVLEELKKSGALYLVTTHYPEVKNYATRETGVLNARMAFDKESLKPLYQLIIGEAGESCAFYIAKRLGMPDSMLLAACRASYGTVPSGLELSGKEGLKKEKIAQLQKKKEVHDTHHIAEKFKRGDSVMILPERKIGIVCQSADDKGMLVIQMPDQKIRINHKRVKLHVSADQLYPEDYDFSILFDSVENRKKRHQMERKYTKDLLIEEDPEL